MKQCHRQQWERCLYDVIPNWDRASNISTAIVKSPSEIGLPNRQDKPSFWRMTQAVEACCCFQATKRSFARSRSCWRSSKLSISLENFSTSNFWPRVRAIGSISILSLANAKYPRYFVWANQKRSRYNRFKEKMLRPIQFADYKTLPDFANDLDLLCWMT